MDALNNSKRKILVFLYTVLAVAIVFDVLMYAIEGNTSGFTSIPRSVYWSIVTLTTVGYGDIAPQSPLGQIVASVIMILGYGIIAVPTGIYSLELVKSYNACTVRNASCPSCGETGHDSDAEFCKFCGNTLEDSLS
jgi:voltage-gated potassium channel